MLTLRLRHAPPHTHPPSPVNSCLNQHTNPESFEKYKLERELELHQDSQAK